VERELPAIPIIVDKMPFGGTVREDFYQSKSKDKQKTRFF